MAARRGPKKGVLVRVIVPKDKREKGNFSLGKGAHEVDIDTKKQPKRVWVSLEDAGAVPVCIAELDKINISLKVDGFVARVDVNSTSRKIRWMAEV